MVTAWFDDYFSIVRFTLVCTYQDRSLLAAGFHIESDYSIVYLVLKKSRKFHYLYR